MRLPGTEEAAHRTDAAALRDVTHGLRPSDAGQNLRNQLPAKSDAISRLDDAVAVSDQAVVAQQFNLILQQIEDSTDAGGLGNALRSLKDFVDEQTNAGFIGGALQQAADLADDLLAQIGNDPDQQFMSLRVAADFKQQSLNSAMMRYETVSFRFSLHAVTDDGVFHMNLGYEQSSQQSDQFMQFMSKETAQIHVVGKMNGLANNPLLQHFDAMAGLLLDGVQPLLENVGPAADYEKLLEFMREMTVQPGAQQQLKLIKELLDVTLNEEASNAHDAEHQYDLVNLINGETRA